MPDVLALRVALIFLGGLGAGGIIVLIGLWSRRFIDFDA